MAPKTAGKPATMLFGVSRRSDRDHPLAYPVDDAAESERLEVRASPFQALYAHWERSQWSVLELDLATDRASFLRLEPEEQAGLVWIFAHRFHAEFNVARLLAPFLLAAPDYEIQLLLATQVADEHRHVQAVLRIYEEVFGVRGGLRAVQALADEHTDPVAETLYGRLEHYVSRLSEDSDEDEFLAAVVVYHLLAEGVIATTAQNLAAGQYERLAFPGLARGQRLVARDEARHIGIGVSYTRRRMETDPERAREVIGEVVAELLATAGELLETATNGMAELVVTGYGVHPQAFYDEAMRLTQLRLRSIGFLD
jgi:ribonucleotide reductase beta subunit family protein with ferritin-like domain